MAGILDHALWPSTQLGSLIKDLARVGGLPFADDAIPVPNSEPDAVCGMLGLEAEPVNLKGANIETQLRRLAPGVLRMSDGRYLGVASSAGDTLTILKPDLHSARFHLGAVRDAVCEEHERPMRAEIDRMVESCGIPPRRRESAIRALLKERIRSTALGRAWQLRVPPGADFRSQLRQAGVIRRLSLFFGAHIAQYVLLLLAWWVVGRTAMSGRVDWASLIAWAALLATIIPLRLLTTLTQGMIAIGAGGLLKQRLLAGVTTLDPDEVRRQGIGELLGRVIESESLESLALGGGLQTVLAVIELSVATVVMTFGAAPYLQLVAFAAWLAAIAWFAADYWRRRLLWTDARLSMTNGLIERMSGHRTRLAQQPREQWHEGEDDEMNRYLHLSQSLDSRGARLLSFIPRGWLILGLAALAPNFLSAGESSAKFSIALGALLLAYQALKRLASGLPQVVSAAVAWRRVAPMFRAAGGMMRPAAALPTGHKTEAAIEAHDLVFTYSGHTDPVLRGCSLRIEKGDFLLLEGGSGAGKSTLTALLTGIRKPTSGVLLSGGLDQQTLGQAGWRKRIALAPQYHENHVLAASLAFNLLLGRHWPPPAADLAEAEALCRELGLGELLDRMPAGLHQIVGETGWQLSQGERSRVFLARALLQDAGVVVLDETFGALDPQTMRQCLECVFRRAPSLLVVAHP